MRDTTNPARHIFMAAGLAAEGNPVELYVNGSSGKVKRIKRKGHGPYPDDGTCL